MYSNSEMNRVPSGYYSYLLLALLLLRNLIGLLINLALVRATIIVE